MLFMFLLGVKLALDCLDKFLMRPAGSNEMKRVAYWLLDPPRF